MILLIRKMINIFIFINPSLYFKMSKMPIKTIHVKISKPSGTGLSTRTPTSNVCLTERQN